MLKWLFQANKVTFNCWVLRDVCCDLRIFDRLVDSPEYTIETVGLSAKALDLSLGAVDLLGKVVKAFGGLTCGLDYCENSKGECKRIDYPVLNKVG